MTTLVIQNIKGNLITQTAKEITTVFLSTLCSVQNFTLNDGAVWGQHVCCVRCGLVGTAIELLWVCSVAIKFQPQLNFNLTSTQPQLNHQLNLN